MDKQAFQRKYMNKHIADALLFMNANNLDVFNNTVTVTDIKGHSYPVEYTVKIDNIEYFDPIED